MKESESFTTEYSLPKGKVIEVGKKMFIVILILWLGILFGISYVKETVSYGVFQDSMKKMGGQGKI